eukprot:4773990-Pleurochrysis_carterae.AAC.2
MLRPECERRRRKGRQTTALDGTATQHEDTQQTQTETPIPATRQQSGTGAADSSSSNQQHPSSKHMAADTASSHPAFLNVLVTPKLCFSLPSKPHWRSVEDISQQGEFKRPCLHRHFYYPHPQRSLQTFFCLHFRISSQSRAY